MERRFSNADETDIEKVVDLSAGGIKRIMEQGCIKTRSVVAVRSDGDTKGVKLWVQRRNGHLFLIGDNVPGFATLVPQTLVELIH
jgi:hypothetical protein